MLGFTDIITNTVQGLRVKEILLSRTFRKLLCGRVFLANGTSTFSPLATFAVFVIIAKVTGKQLDAASSFTALSLISLLASPMNTLIRSIPQLNSAIACFSRIQEFLNSGARMDHRLPLNTTRESSLIAETSTSNSDIELKAFASSIPQDPSQLLVVRNASFGWTSEGHPDVRDINLTLLKGNFCFIIGPVGGGKSTLLKGILGETPSTQGFVYSSSGSIAYNDQTPWIQNATIKQNILGVSNFEESWYNKVIHACALEVDISKLPKGHGKFPLTISATEPKIDVLQLHPLGVLEFH